MADRPGLAWWANRFWKVKSMSGGWYYALAAMLTMCNLLGLAANLVGLPGNWLIVSLTALFAALVHGPHGEGISWWPTFTLIAGMALAGELFELAAGAAGAARQGASRRAMALAMVGGLLGSLLGAATFSVAIPIPLVGTIVGAVVGGSAGTFAGAWCGEYWKGAVGSRCTAVGAAATVGPLVGMVAKLALGAAMVVVTTLAAFFF